MIKKILEININEIKGIKIICNKCGTYLFAPLRGWAPDQCIACKAPIPDKSVIEVKESLSGLINTIRSFDLNMYIEKEFKSD